MLAWFILVAGEEQLRRTEVQGGTKHLEVFLLKSRNHWAGRLPSWFFSRSGVNRRS
jgi:hypothetical protein